MKELLLNEIIPFIGESSPYVYIPENIISIDGDKIEIEIKSENFSNEKFADLIQILSSIGSFSLHNKLEGNKEKRFYLGEKLRIRRCCYAEISPNLIINSSSILESKRKGKSFLNIFNSLTKELLFTFELDYYIIDKNSFENLYDGIRIEYETGFNKFLPLSEIHIKNDSFYKISVGEFDQNQCAGHFDNYPIVPAVFITKCMLQEIIKHSEIDEKLMNIDIDCLEMFLIKAMPINTKLFIEVQFDAVLKNIQHYKCKVIDANNEVYGYYLITLKTSKK